MKGPTVLKDFVESASDPAFQDLAEDQLGLWSDLEPSWIVIGVRGVPHRFLALANSREAERRMAEVLQAFLGRQIKRRPLGSDFAELPATWVAWQFDLDSARTAEQFDQIRTMVRVRTARPLPSGGTAQPISILLRDFHVALAVGDEGAAARSMDAMERLGVLRGENMQFLRIRLWAKFDHWAEILKPEVFDDFTRARRPKLITDILLEALWRRDYAEAAEVGDPEALRQLFVAGKTGDIYSDLFGSIGRPSRIRSRRLLALFLSTTQDEHRLTDLVYGLGESEAESLRKLARVAAGSSEAAAPEGDFTTSIRDMVTLRELLDADDFVGVFTRFLEMEQPSTGDAVVALTAVVELGDPERAREFLSHVSFHAIVWPDRAAVRLQVGAVQEIAAQACNGWLDWADRASGAQWPECLQSLQNDATDWSTEWLQRDDEAERFSQLLLRVADGPNGAALRLGVSALIELATLASEDSFVGPVREAVLPVVVMMDRDSRSMRNALLALVASLDTLPANRREYVDLLDALSAVWGRCRSASTLPWAVQVMDELERVSCPDLGVRDRLAIEVANDAFQFGERVSDMWWNELRRVVGDRFALAPRTPLGADDVERLWSRLAGKYVGIYSLVTGLERVGERIRALEPEVRIELNQDLVWTTALKTIALSADAVVIQWKRAKHAASEKLKNEARGKVLWSGGGSASSILHTLEAYAGELAS